MHSGAAKLIAAWGLTPTPGTVLVAGSKRYPTSAPARRYAGTVIGVDMSGGAGVDLVHDLAKPLAFSVSHVDCCSVLEHCADPFAVARTLQGALITGGSLMLTVPFVWRLHGYPNDYWRFTIAGVKRLFPGIVWKRLTYAVDGEERDDVRIGKDEADENFVRLPRAEVIGWGVKK